MIPFQAVKFAGGDAIVGHLAHFEHFIGVESHQLLDHLGPGFLCGQLVALERLQTGRQAALPGSRVGSRSSAGR
jgi:hypothetical protein